MCCSYWGVGTFLDIVQLALLKSMSDPVPTAIFRTPCANCRATLIIVVPQVRSVGDHLYTNPCCNAAFTKTMESLWKRIRVALLHMALQCTETHANTNIHVQCVPEPKISTQHNTMHTTENVESLTLNFRLCFPLIVLCKWLMDRMAGKRMEGLKPITWPSGYCIILASCTEKNKLVLISQCC